jgi:hypothetical protein
MSRSEQSPTATGGPETRCRTPKNAFTVLFGRRDTCPSEGAEQLSFPRWLPPAVMHAAKRIHAQVATEKDPAKAREILSRLTSDPRMQRVWKRLSRQPASIRYSAQIAENRRRACELRQKGGPENEQEADILEAESACMEESRDPWADLPWSDQELAMQLFLWHVYNDALADRVLLSDLKTKAKTLSTTATQLLEVSATLEPLGKSEEIRQLNDIVRVLAHEAEDLDSIDPRLVDPWIIVRQTGDVEFRTFVGWVSGTPIALYRKSLYGTMATVTNVVLNRDDVTTSKYRELVRFPRNPAR